MNLLAGLKAAWLQPLAERWQGRSIQAKVRVLRKHFALPWQPRSHLARLALIQTVQAAGQFVPYYRDVFRARIFNPLSLRDDLRRFQEIPFLTKAIIREQGDRLLDERAPRQRLHLRTTGGSTGPATKIIYTQDALDWTAAVHRLVLEWTGKRAYHREVHLSSRYPETFPWKDRLREWVKCAILHRWNLETDSLDAPGLEKIWQTLGRVKPFLLQGQPSTVYALALSRGPLMRKQDAAFEVFESTGETLTDHQANIIERNLGCRIFNRYGSAEFGVAAHQTSNESTQELLVLDNVVWPETADSDAGRELVLTGLLNPGMPLLRYRTGDLAELHESSEGLVLRKIHGRVHDMVNLGTKRVPTHYLQDLLDRLGGVDEFQCEELPENRLRLRLVVPRHEQRPTLAAACNQWWGSLVEVEFIEFDQLQFHGSRGKFRHLTRRAA